MGGEKVKIEVDDGSYRKLVAGMKVRTSINRNARARLFASLTVALMLSSLIIPIVSQGSGSDPVTGNDVGEISVTYHHNSSDVEGTEITYNGIASAEYNPVYWKADNGKDNWLAPQGTYTFNLGLTLTYSGRIEQSSFTLPEGMNVTQVSTNSNDVRVVKSDGNTYMVYDTWWPLLDRHIYVEFSYDYRYDYVFGGWSITNQSYNGQADYDPGDILEDVSRLYAVWLTPTLHYKFDAEQGLDNIQGPEIVESINFGDSSYTRVDPQVDNVYTNIYMISGVQKAGDKLPGGTYRSSDGSGTLQLDEPYEAWDGWNGYQTFHDYAIPIDEDVIIDNLRLDAVDKCDTTKKHGDDPDHGLYANGNMLIIGPGVVTVGDSEPRSYPQIFGGYYEGGKEDTDEPLSNTDVVIFSGTYYNVVAGGYDQSVSESTNLVIRGSTTVLDTVIGGNSRSSTDHSVGGTNVYVLGGCLPADSYQEDKLGSSNIPSGVFLDESTILTGGSNNGKVTGDTHVFISGDAKLWDVQGGGRRGASSVSGTVNVDVSGLGTVRHVLCGSITDGIVGNGQSGDPTNANYGGSVEDVRITIRQGAVVASVFGAGYDTYYSPNLASMLEGGSIRIDVEGGTVGYVYGGGYRGAVGFLGNLSNGGGVSSPIDSISINISGGEVLGDVFGGGRGGVDKVTHERDGALSGVGSEAINDSTGFAWTSVRDLSITVSGDATVGGSVYGGGESVPGLVDHRAQNNVALVLAETISISIEDGAKVEGNVFGAGKGVDPDGYSTNLVLIAEDGEGGYILHREVPWYDSAPGVDKDRGYNQSGFAQVGTSDRSNRPDISVSVIGGSVVGDGSTSVFGGGQLSCTYADSIRVVLGNGESGVPILKGDVYGGGLGTSEMFSVESNRSIVLNNARVEGSIFGGTRSGDDGVFGQTSDISRTAEINLIAGTVTQNVFGGGFEGRSMYDVTIRFGTPAVDSVHPDVYPYPTNLRVGSIYGGGYFNPSDSEDDQGKVILMMGDADILIGSSALDGNYIFSGYENIGDAESTSSRIAIYGDVFGEGSFSGIGGTSTIEFSDYRQTSSSDTQRIRSVQLADVVSIIDSEIDLAGSSAGGSEALTEQMALNGIVQLEMHGHSTLTLYSEMNEIGEYSSYAGSEYATPSDFTELCGNTIRMMDGALVMILGEDNDGEVVQLPDRVGIVNGFTIIDNVGDMYYGAFAMGSSQTDEETGGFLIQNDDGTYSRSAVIEEGAVKIWYISGATSMERMLTFNSVGSYSDELDLIIPKISTASKLFYTGAYVDYSIQDSMYVTNQEEYDESSGMLDATNYFSMTIDGNSVASHVFNGVWQTATPVSREIGSNVHLSSSLFGTGPTMVGLLGYVVIHVVESYDYGSVQVPIHTINLIVGMYVEPDGTENIDIEVTLVENGGSFMGVGYIPLPNEGVMYSYSLSDFNLNGIDNDSIGLTADTTYFGRNGWVSSGFMDSDHRVTEGSKSISFGTGGVISPVIRVEYSGDALPQDPTSLEFEVALQPTMEVGYNKTYHVEVEFRYASDVGLYLQYTEVVAGDDGVMNRFVLSVTDNGSKIQWVQADGEEIGDPIPMGFGSVISDYGYAATVVAGSFSRECSTLMEVLDALNESIPEATINGETFVYSERFVGWFSDSTMINKFDMGSNVSQDIILYAKFGINITFHFGNGSAPYETVIPFGTSLQESGMYNRDESNVPTQVFGYEYFNGDREYIGHMLLSTNGWVVDEANPSVPFEFDTDLINNLDLYLVWKTESYDVEVIITNEGVAEFSETSYSVSNSNEPALEKNIIRFEAEYGRNVVIAFNDPFHVGGDEATGTYGEDNMGLNLIGATSSTKILRFNVPDAGDDVSSPDPGRITIMVTVTDLFDVTVEFIHKQDYTSDLGVGDSLLATAGTESVTITSDSPQVLRGLSGGTSITITVGAGSSDYGFEMAVWQDGVLVADGVGDFAVKVGSDVINPRITVALFKTVEILNDPDWNDAHISGISVYSVVTPDSPNGAWVYTYEPVWITPTYFDNGQTGYSVHEHDSFIISPESGYMIDGTNDHPTNTTMVPYGSSIYFQVNGDGDVRFKVLSLISTPLGIELVFMAPGGADEATDQMKLTLGNTMGSETIHVTFNGIRYSITVSEAIEGKKIDVYYQTGQSGIGYDASLGGFRDSHGTFGGGSESITIQLVPIDYSIDFQYMEDDGSYGKVESVSWDVYDGSGIPAPSDFETAVDSNGSRIYIKTTDGRTPSKFIDAVTWDEFDNSRTLHICAVVEPSGSITGSDAHEVVVLVLASDIAEGSSVNIGTGLFGDERVLFHHGRMTVAYDPVSGDLTFTGLEQGTGSIVLTSGGNTLILYVVADPEAIL